MNAQIQDTLVQLLLRHADGASSGAEMVHWATSALVAGEGLMIFEILMLSRPMKKPGLSLENGPVAQPL